MMNKSKPPPAEVYAPTNPPDYQMHGYPQHGYQPGPQHGYHPPGPHQSYPPVSYQVNCTKLEPELCTQILQFLLKMPETSSY